MKIEIPEEMRTTVEDALRAHGERLKDDSKGFYGTPDHERHAKAAEKMAAKLDALADKVGF